MAASDELGRKLRLTRFMILMRQFDEDIPYPKAGEVIKEHCSGDEGQRALCGIALWYGSNKTTDPPDIKNLSLFHGEHPALEAYFQLLLDNDNAQRDWNSKLDCLAGEFKNSPLFAYLALEKLKAEDPAQVEIAYPQFAEAFRFIAESAFQRKRYRMARTYFLKAAELLPDYTRAIIGLGNINFFALEDYEKALSYYEAALEKDPTNTAAQFGKGAALHKLDRYQESNAALDRMLAADLLRNNRIDNANYLYYSGEGNYLKAYNYYLMKDDAKARELVDSAHRFLPDSEEINDLSGVLFFEAKKMEEARKDFLKVIAKGNSNCNAQLHLGLIYQWTQSAGIEASSEDQGGKASRGYQETWSLKSEPPERKALNYFLGASSCMQSAVYSLKGQIDSVPTLDLEPNEKVLLTGRLQNKLIDVRISSTRSIEMMIDEASRNSVSDKGNYVSFMREMLARIRNP